MKVCDVVLNSVWYDPRVRKQIIEYRNQNIDVVAIGLKCNRYDEEKIKNMPCKTIVVKIDSRYDGPQRNVFRKLKRKSLQEKAIVDAIIAEKPDIIHANDLNALIPAYKAMKKLKCKLIYDSHEVFVENFWQNKRYLYSYYLKVKEKRLVSKVDLMVSVSHAAADYFSSE